jgi:hypothetical protein
MAQLCGQFSPFLFQVNNLSIDATQSSSGEDDVDIGQWLELLRSFGGARDFSVAGELATDILCALRPADGGHTTDVTALPSLRNLRVRTPKPLDGPFQDAALSFITSRRLSGRAVKLEFLCHICNTSFTRQQELKSHLIDKHAYRIVCSYCVDGDFELKPGSDHLFRDHLEIEHPEVVRNDEVFSNPFSTLDGLINRHSSLSALGTVALTATDTAPHSPIASDPPEMISDEDHTEISISDPSDDEPDVLNFFEH